MGEVIALPLPKKPEELFSEYVTLLGEIDHERGISFRENPYAKGSMEREAWHRGWWKAFAVTMPPNWVNINEDV